MFNVVNGGKHADSGPRRPGSSWRCRLAPAPFDALRAGAEVYQALKKALTALKMTIAVGDEGGLRPASRPTRRPRHPQGGGPAKPGTRHRSAWRSTAAASEFYKDGVYRFEGRDRSAAEHRPPSTAAGSSHGIVSLEDPLAEDDWSGWKTLTDAIGGMAAVVGDDLSSPTPSVWSAGSRPASANAILIKLNQIGTLSETVDTVTDGPESRLRLHHLASFRRDRGRFHRRPGRGLERRGRSRPGPLPFRAAGEIQPAPAHRGRLGRQGRLRRRGLLQSGGRLSGR